MKPVSSSRTSVAGVTLSAAAGHWGRRVYDDSSWLAGRCSYRTAKLCSKSMKRPVRTYCIAVLGVAIAFAPLQALQPAQASSGSAVRTDEAISQKFPTPASKWRFHGQHDPTRSEDVCDAAEQGDLEFLGAMVRHGLDIDIADAMGRTPLMCAQSGDVADFLLRQGADPNAADRDGYTALHYHLWSDAALSLVPVLLEHGVAPQRSSPPLLKELAVRFIEWRQYHEGAILLEMLVCAGWDVDERDGHGATLLHVAAHNDNLPLAENVLRLEADPSLRDREGRTAATIAQELGSSRVLSRLLEAQKLE